MYILYIQYICNNEYKLYNNDCYNSNEIIEKEIYNDKKK